ncbi:MAG: septum formation initiator family protein [Candidatus Synoicihabitans palmerolidicus]|nr:septum formation initiator family protein [Candidatus Synoicihabitans palmerolidicus]
MVLVFVAMAVDSITFYLQMQAEYKQRQEVERVTAEQLRIAETCLKEQEDMLQRLRTDPSYVELTIRRRLGYAKPNELVFRFED